MTHALHAPDALGGYPMRALRLVATQTSRRSPDPEVSASLVPGSVEEADVLGRLVDPEQASPKSWVCCTCRLSPGKSLWGASKRRGVAG